MYEFIKGKLIDKTLTKAVIEVHGIGFRLTIALSTYTNLPALQTEVFFYLSQVVREDSITLYAFSKKEERDLFEVLISVSGIGPKIALGIIGHIEIKDFEKAIHTSDIRSLAKLPGLGKKTAEKLIIELRDKLKEITKASLTQSEGMLTDAINALINLGHQPLAAKQAVKEVFEKKTKSADLGEIITCALQKI